MKNELRIEVLNELTEEIRAFTKELAAAKSREEAEEVVRKWGAEW